MIFFFFFYVPATTEIYTLSLHGALPILAKRGPLGIDGTGGTARIVMDGKGPAFRLIGTHGGTGDPGSRQGNVPTHQRLPTIRNIEVEGAHAEADGFELIETMQSIFEGVLVTSCRHGIHLIKRNRNVLISHCHIYFNTGVGVYLDSVNLHRSEEHTSELQSQAYLVCRLLLEKKKKHK